ncbi:MAG: hypothetical protein WBG50_07405 [Desulfomonilaceae bacterium]
MKKFFMLLTLMAFMAAAPLAMAAKKVDCCVNGNCQKMTKAECKKAEGKVVKSCKKCKKTAVPSKAKSAQ